MDLGIQILADARVGLRFDTFPQAAYSNLFDVISAATERLTGMAQEAAPKRTGRLASEIHGAVHSYPNRITGVVGVTGGTPNDFAKAAAEEYGAHGLAHLKAHQQRLSHIFARAVSSMDVMVAAHDRRVNVQARDYLRGPLHEIEGEVVEQMQAAVQEAAALE